MGYIAGCNVPLWKLVCQEAIEAHEVSEAFEAPEACKAFEIPRVSEAFEAPEVSEEFEALEAPEMGCTQATCSLQVCNSFPFSLHFLPFNGEVSIV